MRSDERTTREGSSGEGQGIEQGVEHKHQRRHGETEDSVQMMICIVVQEKVAHKGHNIEQKPRRYRLSTGGK